MISIAEALSHVVDRAQPLAPRSVAIDTACGLVLAQDVISDVDSPPYDKSLVDGYALRSCDLQATPTSLRVLEEITAGTLPNCEVTAGTATRIMTGAPMPDGADCVVMVERTESVGDQVRVHSAEMQPGQNVMMRATSIRRGATVLTAGQPLRPIECGLLCELGRGDVMVYPRARIGIVATGNELVGVGESIQLGQIRNSNGPMLRAMVEESGATAIDLGIGRDDPDALGELIARGLQYDVLLLSGGVSAGVLDLVPATLERLGVRKVFHKVSIKPGKPIWFGVRPTEAGSTASTLVFGLPGNPVSSLVCFQVFVRPAICGLSGRGQMAPAAKKMKLYKPHRHRGDRPTYFPARILESGMVKTLPWRGSADLATLSQANCFAFFPGEEREYSAGDLVDVFRLG